MPEVRTATTTDVLKMKDKLRKSDLDEVWASSHYDGFKALGYSYLLSTIKYSVYDEGEPVAMFGTAPVPNHGAVVWLLATDGLEKIKMYFLKNSKKYIREMLDAYGVLFNFVDARNKTSIEWLRWCGAEIGSAAPHGKEGMKFHYFIFERSERCVT